MKLIKDTVEKIMHFFYLQLKLMLRGYPFQPLFLFKHLSGLWLCVCRGHPVNIHVHTNMQKGQLLILLPLVT